MENIYAMMILYHAGKEVTEEVVKDILEAAGIIWDRDQILCAVRGFHNTDVSNILSTVPNIAVNELPTKTKEEAQERGGKDKDDEDEPRGLRSLFGDD